MRSGRSSLPHDLLSGPISALGSSALRPAHLCNSQLACAAVTQSHIIAKTRACSTRTRQKENRGKLYGTGPRGQHQKQKQQEDERHTQQQHVAELQDCDPPGIGTRCRRSTPRRGRCTLPSFRSQRLLRAMHPGGPPGYPRACEGPSRPLKRSARPSLGRRLSDSCRGAKCRVD